ncbi:hypothetical protein CLV56_3553 [Mumia flava]|uniref:Collagen triple helix repeat protein n=1 Tax=Mumia flava TaxID=1348852 RepID=A0A0B2BPW6_9ACTN|nr:hypothetical protein [Mumia flava]PJJ54049.1 hypothetical protein CLV56_3553 [Mumia flava]
MVTKHGVVLLAAGVVCGLLVGGTATYAVSSQKTVKVCVTKSKVVRSANKNGTCPRRTTKKAIAVRGPAGPRGPRGPRGAPGTSSMWGVVAEDGTIASGSYRIKAVTKPNAAHQFCVQPAVSLPVTRLRAAQVRALGGPGTVAYVGLGAPNCPAGWFDVSTWLLDSVGAGAEPLGFSLVVP